tara:strand:- start:8900 stop:9667 length:768 start_codon:yes stop_codon:yes gene_type:complete
MATLTYDPTPADQPEFNEAEQEAIAIGEAAEAEQQQMLAGKFKDAEALEQAYIELQKKLGESNEPEEDEGLQREEETAEEEVNPNYELLNKASEEYYSNDGTLSQETIDELSQLDSTDLIAAYIDLQGQTTQNNDLTDQQAAEIRGMVGGDEGYAALTEWAAGTLDESYITAYDNIVETGDMRMIELAVAGLQAEYERQNGYEGEMLTGKAAQPQADVFRSQAEVVAAMQDPRYDNDPAYRNDVFQKLGRSNIQY